MRRSLSLNRETLTVLGEDELSGIAGGSHVDCGIITHGASCDSCPSLPINPCLDGLTTVTAQFDLTLSQIVCL